MASSKIIVTNWSALQTKYGTAVSRVRDAVTQLIAADQQRGLTTKLVRLDADADMKAVHGTAVTKPLDERQVKAAIDAVCAHHAPDYLMILGGPDIVPLQSLRNPTPDDDDPDVPSDLPYASPEPYSTWASKFIGPSRVVGRLPDLMGATEPSALVKVLGIARKYRTRTRKDYDRYFGLSAQVWEASTALSLSKLFGNASELKTSPPSGPSWTSAQLARRVHFINCHGASSAPEFYGQPPHKKEYPTAHEAKRLKSKISNGAVIAAECCFGAQLYDPADSGGQMSICSTCLLDGAYGFFGSTNTAYGPSEGNGQADLICQFFLEAVRNGASLGRAALEARQRFAALYSHLDPTDLKTLAQFSLLGDPSVQAVGEVPHALARTKTFKRTFDAGQSASGARSFRRERLARTGANLQQSLGSARGTDARVPEHVARVLAAAARESGVRDVKLGAHRVVFPPAASKGAMRDFARSRGRRAIYTLVGKAVGTERLTQTVILVATVQGNRIVHLRRVHSR